MANALPSAELSAEGGPVSELGLPRRAFNACVALGIKTIGELASHTSSELSRLPNFGPKSLNNVREALAAHGLVLADGPRRWAAKERRACAHGGAPPMPDDLVRLHLLLRELRDDGYLTPPYHRVRDAALDGLIPATNRNGLWYAHRHQKADLVEALGLKRHASAATPRNPQRRPTAA